MKAIYLKCIAAGVALLLAFIAGYRYASNVYEAQIAQYQIASLNNLNDALTKKYEIENVFSQKLSSVQSSYGVSLTEIDRNYHDLLSMGPDDSPSDNFNGVLNNKTNSTGDRHLSDTSSASGGVSACECKCPSADKAKLQRLYEEQLMVARDCDITASKYNALYEYTEELIK